MWDVGGLGRTPAASLLQARCRPNRVDSDRPGEYGQQCILWPDNKLLRPSARSRRSCRRQAATA